MKIACQEGLVPGDSLGERLEKLSRWGYQGIEFGGHGIVEREQEILGALQNSAVRASTICAGYRGCFLDPDPAQRQLAMDDMRRLLDVAGAIGAVGVICVPIFGGPRLPNLSPLADAIKLEKDLFVRILKDLAPHAKAAKATILVESLNRYETHLLRKQEDSAAICRRVGHPNVQIMSDFFHMSLEELDIPRAIKKCGKHIKHVHLADSTRLQPGTARTDFRAGFKALKDAGFKGYMALECGIQGERERALEDCARFLLECLAG